MIFGIFYDFDEGCVICGVFIVVMIGVFYVILVEMVGEFGLFLGYKKNVKYMLCVICNYWCVVYGEVVGYEGLNINLVLLDYVFCFELILVECVKKVWDWVLVFGE